MKRVCFGIFLLFLFPLTMVAQRATICGYITDAESGERLIGATVFDTVSHLGTVSNHAGFYSLTLPKGEHVLRANYVGFRTSDSHTLTLTADTLCNFPLRSATVIEEVTVVGQKSVSSPEAVQMSAIEVPVSQIKAIPMIAGEVDIIKALQLLPGVQSGSEGSAGLYVRGGGPDENLILLDGVPLYNVNHLMGFFSVFNADAIKNVTLYKGNFPAQYGGRLSSIIDVRQNDGNTEGYHGNFTVGLLAAKFNLEGPIPHVKDSTGTTTFNISARRTYFDLFTTPIMELISLSRGGGTMGAGAYFYDINAKLSHTFANTTDKLSASFYMGNDAVYLNMLHNEREDVEKMRLKMNMRMGWGNIVAALNWEHCYTSRLFSNTQLSFTQYKYSIAESMTQVLKRNGITTATFEQQMSYNSSLRDVTFQTHYEWTPLPNNSLRFGAEYAYHQFRPEVGNLFLFEQDADNETRLDTTLSDGTLHGHEAAVYIEDQWSPWRWLKLNIGVRGSLYGINGKVYPSIEPRVGLRALLYKDLAFKASYSYTTQYVHLLSNSDVSLPTDLWVPVTEEIAPMHSMIAAAGLSYNILDLVEASVEGYYKRSVNLLEYKDGASFFGSSTTWQNKVVMGDGWSYGVEVLLQRKTGPVTGWVGYTWSRSMRQFNREGQEINFGRPFHAKYDREHDLSITLQYQINKHIDIAGTFVYGTGTRATLATQHYYDPTLGEEVEYFEERNNYQMPDYHRLDLGINFHFPHKYSAWGQQEPTREQQRKIWNRPNKLAKHQAIYESGKYAWCKNAEHLLNISIYNVYCHSNPYMMIADATESTLYQVSIFPILPSISYTFKF
ncbi:MAG: carboxypeptidase-like regulatory domain-containing protein [Paludibacteraceae bacterium]